MSTVIADISMSLDGYVTGPEPRLDSGLGQDGDAIHGWVFNAKDSPRDRQFLEDAASRTGAVIMGWNTFDFVDGPNGWNADIGYGYDQGPPELPPIFVVTHTVPENPRNAFTFVTDGVAAAVKAAREAAGERDVIVQGGASVIDQALAGGLVDELRIHLSPVLMGAGTRLFDLVGERVLLAQTDVVITDHATHLTYRVS